MHTFVEGKNGTMSHVPMSCSGCAVDIRCKDKKQAIRYGCILLDIADGKKMDFDELILEKRGTTIWVHFAVKPRGNRRYVDF